MTLTAETYIAQVLDALPRATPQRDQIAVELRGHIAERRAAGQPEEDVLRQLGDPVTLAESYLAGVPLAPGTFGARAAAKLVDVALVGSLAAVGGWILWQTLPAELAPFAIAGALVGGSWIFAIYTIVAETRTGQTLGKRLMGLRVVRESGARIGAGQAIVRQLPMFLEIFLIDALFALFTARSQRAFELLSRTRVVRMEERSENER